MIEKFFDKIKVYFKTYNFIKSTIFGNKKVFLKINSPIELWRFKTYKTKEPETIEWIKTFKKNEIFYDIGANIGLYGLFAEKQKCEVYAFEPATSNFSSLIKNIELNKSKIRCFNIGLSNIEKISKLNLVSTIEGDSQHNLNIKQNLYSRKFLIKQGLFVTSLDKLVKFHGFKLPNHIKIDVDGHEKEILQGARNLLKYKSLKSIMVEINFKNYNEYSLILNIMKKNNFQIKNKSKRIYSNKLIQAQNIYFYK